MIKVKINLTSIPGVKKTKTKNGKKALIIPIEQNGFYIGKKGVYMDIVMFESDVDFADYSVLLDTPKGEENIFIGNANIWGRPEKQTDNIPEEEEEEEENDEIPW